MVTVLDRFSRGKTRPRAREARIDPGGHPRPWHIVRAAAEGADVIWHLAYVQGTQTFYADPKDVIDVALKGIMNVLGVRDVKRTSPTCSSSPQRGLPEPAGRMFPTDETVPLSVPDVTNPRYSYGGGKIASELATLAYAQAGMLERAVIVRPHNSIGPDMGDDHVIPEFASGDAGAHQATSSDPGRRPETRCFSYIDDCVDGLMVLLEKGEDRYVYHLGNPREEHTIAALAAQDRRLLRPGDRR